MIAIVASVRPGSEPNDVGADARADVAFVQVVFHAGVVLIGHADHPVQRIGREAVVVGVVDRVVVGVHRAGRGLHHHRRDDVLQDVVVDQVSVATYDSMP